MTASNVIMKNNENRTTFNIDLWNNETSRDAEYNTFVITANIYFEQQIIFLCENY